MEEWLLCSLLAAVVVAFLILESRRGGTTVTHHQATRLINDGKAVLIDLRDSKEYKAGHIVDAINIPYASLNTRLDELEKHKSKQLIVVDKMGQHAGAAGRVLREKGYTVLRLQGGMMEWTQQNLPVVKA
jgi:Rhodanese-related sulfurtransferase